MEDFQGGLAHTADGSRLDQHKLTRKVEELVYGIKNLSASSDLEEVSPLISLFDEIRTYLNRPELSKITKEAQERVSILTKAKNFPPATRLKDKICKIAAKAIS